MRLLIIGRGWTGNKLYNQALEMGLQSAICPHVNYKPFSEVYKPHVIINCAGYTGSPNVDACEDNKNEVYQANAVFPIEVYEFCKLKGIQFAHFSSGCIYQGTIKSVYCDPNFFKSTYSISKGISDKYLKDKAWVFRIRMPFDSTGHHKNFLTKIRNYNKLWNGGLNSLSHHDEAISVALDTIIRDLSKGPYNLVNQGAIDLPQICKELGIQKEWMSNTEFKSITKCERSNCIIPADYRMRHILDALCK